MRAEYSNHAVVPLMEIDLPQPAVLQTSFHLAGLAIHIGSPSCWQARSKQIELGGSSVPNNRTKQINQIEANQQSGQLVNKRLG